jgi:hypothetical protein
MIQTTLDQIWWKMKNKVEDVNVSTLSVLNQPQILIVTERVITVNTCLAGTWGPFSFRSSYNPPAAGSGLTFQCQGCL